MSNGNVSNCGNPSDAAQGPKRDNCTQTEEGFAGTGERFIAVIPFVDIADDSPGVWVREIRAATIKEAWARLSTLENGPEADLLDELIGSEVYGLPPHHHYRGPNYLGDYGLRVGEGHIYRLSEIPVASLEIDPDCASEQSSSRDTPAPSTTVDDRPPSPLPDGSSQFDPYSSWICRNGLSVRENALKDVDPPGLYFIDMMRIAFCRRGMQGELATGKGTGE